MFHHLNSPYSVEFPKMLMFISNHQQLSSNIDEVVWNLTSTGTFTAKFAYVGLKNQPTFTVYIHRVWKMKVPPRMKIFAWLVYYRKILTAKNLMKRGWNLPSICVLFRKENEFIKHLFSECTFTLLLYESVTRVMRLQQEIGKKFLGKKKHLTGLSVKEENQEQGKFY